MDIIKQNDETAPILQNVSLLIEQAKHSVAYQINSTLVQLYWNIGKCIKEAILKQSRADYGKRIVHSLSEQLTKKYGSGYGRTNIFNMIKFYEVFPDGEIVHSLSGQLSWTHFKLLIYIDDPLKRDFYCELARIEHWNTRLLQKKVDSMLYERTGLAHKPDKLIKKELDALRETQYATPDLVLRDPYIIDFLGMPKDYSENELEHAILNELESFIEELGTGFCFVARQKRICIGKKDHYLDLLFFNRMLRRLVAIELKLGDFHAHYKGQMELYLKWLSKHDRLPHEKEPLGIILCADKNQEEVELLEVGKSGIHVAQYLTELPPKNVLAKKLHQAIATAKATLSTKPED